MNEVILSVPDISCDHCKNSIEEAVGELGVESVSVAVAEKTVEVRFNDPIDEPTIIATIEEQGYEVE